jgi:hypothetical protein
MIALFQQGLEEKLKIISQNYFLARVAIFALAALSISGCSKTNKLDQGLDTTSSGATTAGGRNDPRSIPSLQSLPNSAMRDSILQSLQKSASAKADQDPLASGDGLESIEPAQVQFKYVSRVETAVPGVYLYIVKAERSDSTATLRTIVQYGVTPGAKDAPPPVNVKITGEQFAKAKLLDDKTGVTHHLRLDGNARKGVSWKLESGSDHEMILTFESLPRNSTSATLIIPDFVTVAGVPFSAAGE